MNEASLQDDVFIQQLQKDMLRFARLQLQNEAQAEDVVQEALLAALSKHETFAGRSSLKTWVFAILKNKIVDLIRQQSRTRNVSAFGDEENTLDEAFEQLFLQNAHWAAEAAPQRWANPEENLREKNFWLIFDRCLDGLPKNTARVFMMREFLEMETAEICESLAITVSNCNVILHRARNALRQCLQKNWFGPGGSSC